MAERRWFHCKNCGHSFETQVLSSEEARRRRERREPVGSLHCPRCNRTDIRSGRE